ncbi:hypothetical protein OROMI_009812 [Orobanche minor]
MLIYHELVTTWGLVRRDVRGVRWSMLRTMVNLENRLFEACCLRVRPSYDIHMGRDTLEYGPAYITMWRQRYFEYGPHRTSTWDAILLSMVHRISTCGGVMF